MKKFVAVFQVDSFHKKGTDQQGIGDLMEETVTTILRLTRNPASYKIAE